MYATFYAHKVIPTQAEYKVEMNEEAISSESLHFQAFTILKEASQWSAQSKLHLKYVLYLLILKHSQEKKSLIISNENILFKYSRTIPQAKEKQFNFYNVYIIFITSPTTNSSL